MKQGWITDECGNKYHYVDDKPHNDNGPAIIFTDGSKIWCKNNKRHREDGPAAEYSDGDKSWWYEGQCIGNSFKGFTKEKFEQWLKFKAFL